MDLMQKHFSSLGFGITVFQIGPSQTEGFDLRSGQYQTGFNGFLNLVIMMGLAVLADYFDMFGHKVYFKL